jgi:hypothetical protein
VKSDMTRPGGSPRIAQDLVASHRRVAKAVPRRRAVGSGRGRARKPACGLGEQRHLRGSGRASQASTVPFGEQSVFQKVNDACTDELRLIHAHEVTRIRQDLDLAARDVPSAFRGGGRAPDQPILSTKDDQGPRLDHP